MQKFSGAGVLRLAAAAALSFTLSGVGAAHASFISTSNPPDLFPVGSIITGTPASTCITSGPFDGLCTSNTMTTITGSTMTYDLINFAEDIVLDGVVSGDTNYGPFSLTGTEDLTIENVPENVNGGTYQIAVTAEDFTGMFLGQSIALTLDPSGLNDGLIMITFDSAVNGFLIDTTLNIAHQLSIDGGPPFSIGTAQSGVDVLPEPSALALLAFPLCALICLRALRDRQAARAAA